MAKLLHSYIVITIIVFSLFVNANITSATGYDFGGSTGLTDTAKQTGHVVDGTENKVPEIIGDAVSIILTFLGTLFLILMIYGGYIWMMARGNEQETEKAKSIIRNALIGIIVVLAAYAITAFIGSELNPFSWLQNPNGGIIEQDLTE